MEKDIVGDPDAPSESDESESASGKKRAAGKKRADDMWNSIGLHLNKCDDENLCYRCKIPGHHFMNCPNEDSGTGSTGETHDDCVDKNLC